MWHGVATGLSIQGDGFDSRIDRKKSTVVRETVISPQ